MDKPTRIILRHVAASVRAQAERGFDVPHCRNKDCIAWADWNAHYVDVARPAGGRSLYWCGAHLPPKYRLTAESMIRGNEQERIVAGAAPDRPDEPPAPKRPMPGSRIPWRQLL